MFSLQRPSSHRDKFCHEIFESEKVEYRGVEAVYLRSK